MRLFHLKCLGLAALAAALAGCAGGASQYVQPAPGHPVSHQALADEVYLDGTGPSARGMAAAPRAEGVVEQRQSYVPPSGVTKPVVRTRPTAIPRERADAISATTGTRSGGGGVKPFSDEWWEKEKQEDARLRSKMNICRGC